MCVHLCVCVCYIQKKPGNGSAVEPPGSLLTVLSPRWDSVLGSSVSEPQQVRTWHKGLRSPQPVFSKATALWDSKLLDSNCSIVAKHHRESYGFLSRKLYLPFSVKRGLSIPSHSVGDKSQVATKLSSVLLSRVGASWSQDYRAFTQTAFQLKPLGGWNEAFLPRVMSRSLVLGGRGCSSCSKKQNSPLPVRGQMLSQGSGRSFPLPLCFRLK